MLETQSSKVIATNPKEKSASRAIKDGEGIEKLPSKDTRVQVFKFDDGTQAVFRTSRPINKGCN